MQVTSLRAFVDRVAEAQRLRFGDLRRLRRDVLPDGLQSRDDVEALERADGGWPEYLLEAVKGFVISASDPQGLVDPELTHWLVSVLSDAQPKTAVRIARCGVASRGGGRCPARVRQGERQANGKAKAVTATARKIAVLFYNALRHGMDYADPGASYYEERYRHRVRASAVS
jgi:hypothetical protein